MEKKKVYLRIATPRTLKDPGTLRMALIMVLSVLSMIAVTVMVFATGNEAAPMFVVIVPVWLFSGAIPCMLMIFNSYAFMDDGKLVVNNLGMFEKRFPRSQIDQVKLEKGRIALSSQGKVLVSLPDNEAARELVRSLGLQVSL